MVSGVDERFIETPGFPIVDVNEASAREKSGGGRPPFWEMVFWWTRKPLAGARAIIAGALLPAADVRPIEFKYHLRLTENTPHRSNPVIPPRWREQFARVKLLDPFAGFGSIPLEGVRLGLGEVVAVELLPTAYIFLKAVLEHPKWVVDRGLGRRLVEDVRRWGEYVVENLRSDPDVRELYEEEVAVYIGSWEIKCPHCGRWTPLVGNWWLARVSRGGSGEEGEEEEEGVRSGTFRRLAWMEPTVHDNGVYVKIVDLNRELGRGMLTARVNSRQGVVEVEGRQYRVPRPNIDARRETATCLACNNPMRRTSRGEWYVKEALRDWNQKLEQYLTGQVTLETLLREAKARPRILAKVKIVNRDLEFEPATQEDNEKLWKALEKLKQMWGDPDIPIEPLPHYENRSIWVLLYGFDKWFKLFNPRQLLTLVKLVKLIREAGKKIEEEKLREGWSREDAYKYAEAVTTYLAMKILHTLEYDSIVTYWDPTFWGELKVKSSFAFRGIAMNWNWCEYNIVEGFTRFSKYVDEGLEYLVSAVSGSSSRVRVLLDDATVLGSLGGERFDLIVTDPPYRDDVPYAELSDFYYVWLKRALSDVGEVAGVSMLIPRFYPEAFFRDGVEVETQWKVFAPREVSESEGRARYFGVGDAFTHFKGLLNSAFKTMADRLADNGVLVTYYAHTSPEAWEALLEAGWRNARLRITGAYAVITESAQRVTARGKAGLDISIVAVWRRGVNGQALVGEVHAEALRECTRYASNLIERGFDGVNLFVGVLGCTLSVFTRYEKVIGVRSVEELVEKYVYPATAEAIARALGGEEEVTRLSSASLFYLLGKVLIGRRPRQARRTLDRSTLAILAIGTRNEIETLRRLGLVVQDDERFQLQEPIWGQRDLVAAIRSTLEDRRVDPMNPVARTAVDVLQLLEFYAITLPASDFARRAEELRSRYPAMYEEALTLAKLLASEKLLPRDDPERELASRVIRALAPGRAGLDRWLGGGKR